MSKNILKFNGQLIDIMGEEDTRKKHWLNDLGLKASPDYQYDEDGETFSLMEVVDETKCQKYFNHPRVEVLTVDEANIVIDEKFKPRYKIYNNSLFSANLNTKLSQQLANGTKNIDLDAMSSNWTENQESEYLYSKGISGIKKIEPPKGFTV